MSTKHWSDTVPLSVIGPFTPGGDECQTPTDRRWLWHLEGFLSVRAPMGSEIAAKQKALRQYLNETCTHEWVAYTADEVIDAHRQCLWCHDVEWEADRG